ncbi:ARM repeat-containing protein [Dacryopinax primogenitus]|uniref:ARM repeat-containing protein n=1 Tax=Dacryopinax primogenitus (strain DJM 731) TaxID=1858805 RepID=M5FU25_DACPD|nr:ARM repeat-containing protein [Dacryopinax primogenitus]EJT98994.1 ARM repeat-containing protein [Dacryopinax primogenitus]
MSIALKTSTAIIISEEEIDALFAFLSPSQPKDVRTQGTVTFATYVSHTRQGKSPEAGTAEIERTLTVPLEARISSTDVSKALEGLALLTTLFTVDPLSGTALLANEGLQSHLTDLPDIFPGNNEIEGSLAGLLSQASDVKACRALVSKDWGAFLRRAANRGGEGTKTRAMLALLKLSHGGEGGGDVNEKGVDVQQEEEIVLARSLAQELVCEVEKTDEPLDTVEALAHLSMTPAVREDLSRNSPFLRSLFVLAQWKKRATLPLLYGVSVIICNIVTYRPKLAGDEAQLDRLRRMAKGGMVHGSHKLRDEPIPKLEMDEAVQERCRRLLKAGVVPVLVALTRSGGDSAGVRASVGGSFLSLAEDKENRGLIIQAGGAKALQTIIQTMLAEVSKAPSSSLDPPHTDAVLLSPIQALAKLAITSSPLLLFGPTPASSIDAIRPFCTMLSNSQSSLLQQFEALMALTNLASLGPEISNRISGQPGSLSLLDQLMLHDNTLLRRASVELVCNLVSYQAIFQRYTTDPGSKGRLHVLLALSDVDDKPTRLAASGALAMLTDSPEACNALLSLPKGAQNTFTIVAQLIDPGLVPKIVELDSSEPLSESDMSDNRSNEAPDPGLQHRGTLLLRNLLLNTKPQADARVAEKAGAVLALVTMLKTFQRKEGCEGMVTAAVESLTWFVRNGVRIQE